MIYYLSENSFELVKDSFNLKHRYLTKINNNVNHVNILMSLENQTIGFIDNCFKDITKTKRQKDKKTKRQKDKKTKKIW